MNARAALSEETMSISAQPRREGTATAFSTCPSRVTGMWDVAAVQARVADLAAEDPDLLRYGADKHHYAFGPTVLEARVTGFEARHGVRLPESYRRYLLEVGDGGVGPENGVVPLSGEGLHASLDLPERSWSGHLAMPFPLTERENPSIDADNPIQWPRERGTNGEDFSEKRWIAGTLIICDAGCGSVYRLVVTGEARGQVWSDNRYADLGLTPGPDFHTWYLNWLAKPGHIPAWRRRRSPA